MSQQPRHMLQQHAPSTPGLATSGSAIIQPLEGRLGDSIKASTCLGLGISQGWWWRLGLGISRLRWWRHSRMRRREPEHCQWDRWVWPERLSQWRLSRRRLERRGRRWPEQLSQWRLSRIRLERRGRPWRRRRRRIISAPHAARRALATPDAPAPTPDHPDAD